MKPEPARRDAADPVASPSSTTSGPGAADIAAFFRRLGPAGVLAGIAAFLPAIGGFVLLGTLTPVGNWLKSHGDVGGVAVYIAGFALFSGLALLPTYAQAILGGWAFGFAIGFPAALGGFAGGATVGYVVARFASGDRVMKILDEHPRWRAVYDALLAGGFWKQLGMITLLRLPPNSPFAMTNLVLAATKARWTPFAIGTVVGMAPRTALAVYLASGLRDLSDKPRESWWLFAAKIAVTIGVVVVIGVIAQRALHKATGQPPRAPASEPL